MFPSLGDLSGTFGGDQSYAAGHTGPQSVGGFGFGDYVAAPTQQQQMAWLMPAAVVIGAVFIGAVLLKRGR